MEELGLHDLGDHPEIWKFIFTITAGIANITGALRRDSMIDLVKLLRTQPAAIHTNREDMELELKESLHYIFDALLPFLSVSSPQPTTSVTAANVQLGFRSFSSSSTSHGVLRIARSCSSTGIDRIVRRSDWTITQFQRRVLR